MPLGHVSRNRTIGSALTCLTLVGLAGWLLINAGVAAGSAQAPEPLPNFDIRAYGGPGVEALERAYAPAIFEAMRRSGEAAGRAMQSEIDHLRSGRPGFSVTVSPITGSAEVVRAGRGARAAPARGRPASETTLAFLRDHSRLYGLSGSGGARFEVIGESLSRASGLRTVRLRQTVRGLPVFQSETGATFDRDGRLVQTVGRIVPGIEERLVPEPANLMSASEALRAALLTVGIDVAAATLRERPIEADGRSGIAVDSADPVLRRAAQGRLVYFPLGEGALVPSWAQTMALRDGRAYYTVVDGRSGTLLFRKSLRHAVSTQDARLSVYARSTGRPEESPAPGIPNNQAPGAGTQYPAIARLTVAMHGVADPVASPDGWIPDGGDTTTGNNVDAFLSRAGNLTPDLGTLDRDGRPVGNPDAFGRNRDFLGAAPRNFDYTPAPLGSDPDAGDDPSTPAFQRGAVTNLFYLANWYHDRLYNLGFDEAAGNFQTNNFGRGGIGADAMLAFAQEGADIGSFESAFSLVSPDGEAGWVVCALFDGPTPDRDSCLDSAIVLHELTHGLSNRLIGNGAGLSWQPGSALGEGWSDFYALALLYDRAGDNPNLQYPAGAYTTYQAEFSFLPPGSFTDNYLYSLRRFPYSTDNLVNPLTWADADQTTFDISGGIAPSPFQWERFGASETHSIGEIWAESLWEARSRIIAAQGGDVTAGNEIMLQTVTDALKMTPIDPTAIEARDALLDADCAARACADETPIWEGFADRGLGYGAAASLPRAIRIGVHESFSVPHLDPGGLIVDDASGNGNGFLEPGETASIQVTIANPWRSATRDVPSATATLSVGVPGVSILDGSSSYGAIPAQGSAVGDPFVVSLSGAVTCGGVVPFTLTINSLQGTVVVDLPVRIGRPDGTGPEITFTRSIPGGLAIPDDDNLGVMDSLNVTQDLEIADLDVRIDELRHPFVGNLSVFVRGPGGLGETIIWHPAQCAMNNCLPGNNDGDDFIMTRLDDAAKKDLYSAGNRKAPFTNSYLPALNSKKFLFGTDPVGQLGRFNGTRTVGAWTLLVDDFRAPNSGTLYSWSLIVTPVAYVCGP
jgi:subtilisin-like proprotein convertase family protein